MLNRIRIQTSTSTRFLRRPRRKRMSIWTRMKERFQRTPTRKPRATLRVLLVPVFLREMFLNATLKPNVFQKKNLHFE